MSLARPGEMLMKETGQAVRFCLSGPHLPQVDTTVRVAAAFRSSVLAALQVLSGQRESLLLSGHLPNGRPAQGHRHAFYLPSPDNGRLRAISVVSPFERFSDEELAALRLVCVLQWNGPGTKTKVELIDEDDATFRRVAAVWTTVTPYVPTRRFFGTHGKHHLVPERQLVAELMGLVPANYEVMEIRKTSGRSIHVRVADTPGGVFRPVTRQGFHVRFRCDVPLCGPVVLGHSAHFGLGQFRCE